MTRETKPRNLGILRGRRCLFRGLQRASLGLEGRYRQSRGTLRLNQVRVFEK